MINHCQKDYIFYILFIEILYYFSFYVLSNLISSVTCTTFVQLSFEFLMYMKSYHQI